ncbi:F-box/kelch-repeat protein [Vitis vinifera]|uniref:F-box/kelch-repeat protein n=1 Tax=Vitis vinifera TaxID=29760 RepID=A0A438GBE8_VITVI|nr:F-box/kelch-repeat protein [Vitis vinifera]
MVCMDFELNTSIYTVVNDNACVGIGFCSIGCQLVGSCNGILCSVYGFNTFYLLNPSVREHKTLPYPGEIHFGRAFYGYLLHGFGYDSSTDDYKLFRGSYSTVKSTIEIFSLKTNSWREFKSSLLIILLSIQVFFVNTALHWATDKVSDGDGMHLGNRVVSFDLKEEKFMEVPLPDETVLDPVQLLGSWEETYP